jgi:hypothetical protein
MVQQFQKEMNVIVLHWLKRQIGHTFQFENLQVICQDISLSPLIQALFPQVSLQSFVD